jgi:hypothetical protein
MNLIGELPMCPCSSLRPSVEMSFRKAGFEFLWKSAEASQLFLATLAFHTARPLQVDYAGSCYAASWLAGRVRVN